MDTTCGKCTAAGRNDQHLFYQCPNGGYAGCTRCGQQGHKSVDCLNKCTACNKVGMAGLTRKRSHEPDCPKGIFVYRK